MNHLRKLFSGAIYEVIESIVAFVCLISCVLIAVLSFLGLDLGVKRNVVLILALLPIICFMVFVQLKRIERKLNEESRYFSDSDSVVHEMIRMCDDANDYILTVGTRAKKPLLECIERVIATKEVYYRRVISDPDYVSEDLRKHANRTDTRDRPCVVVAEKKNCPNFLLTEKRVMVILPIPESGKFRGVLLSSQSAVDQYQEYFNQLYFDKDACDWQDYRSLAPGAEASTSG